MILCLLSQQIVAQHLITIDTIILTGHKKTKNKTITFENPIKQGDTYSSNKIEKDIENSRLQLLSSGLFNDINVSTNYNADSSQVSLTYDITENWYLFPAPIFELADRNFNVWWQDFDRDFNRTNYGARLAHYNLTGRRDKLKFLAHTGYLRKLELTYDLPNVINDNWGVGINVFYSDRREVSYKTEFNKPLFFQSDDDRVLYQEYRAGFILLNRPNTFLDQLFRLEYYDRNVDNEVVELNPDFFADGERRQRYFLLEYDFILNKTNYNLYPTSGYKIRINAKKEGLFIFNEIDNTFITASGKYYQPITNRLTATTQWEAKTNLSRSRQSYVRNKGLGWTDFLVTGYDLYVIDGPDYIISKNYLAWNFLDFTIKTLDIIPRQFRTIPILAYLRVNFDLTYVNEPTYIDTNNLNNTLIYGFGPALDIIAFNNYLFAIEYGITRELESSVFIKTSISF